VSKRKPIYTDFKKPGTRKSLWFRREKTEAEKELKLLMGSNFSKKGFKSRFNLKLTAELRQQFLMEYEKKSIKPLRLYFMVLLWAVAIIGPAQDLSTLQSLDQAVPFLIGRYGVLVPALVFLFITLLRFFRKRFLKWIKLVWALYMPLLCLEEIGKENHIIFQNFITLISADLPFHQ
jgi:hypothetical protein